MPRTSQVSHLPYSRRTVVVHGGRGGIVPALLRPLLFNASMTGAGAREGSKRARRATPCIDGTSTWPAGHGSSVPRPVAPPCSGSDRSASRARSRFASRRPGVMTSDAPCAIPTLGSVKRKCCCVLARLDDSRRVTRQANAQHQERLALHFLSSPEVSILDLFTPFWL